MIPLNISFRRWLVGNNLIIWFRLVARVAHIRLTGGNDMFIWGLLQNGMFIVKSMYNAMIIDTRLRYNMVLWKMKVCICIKFFLWYFKCGVVLTKYNLVRRNWSGNKLYVFYSHSESIQHLFFDCHFARFLWRAVQVTFNIDVPIFTTHMFNGWIAGLGNQFKKLVLIRVAALCWTLWTSRNDVVFDISHIKT
jgi:hypothetical protein